jgi:hypothetical protein
MGHDVGIGFRLLTLNLPLVLTGHTQHGIGRALWRVNAALSDEGHVLGAPQLHPDLQLANQVTLLGPAAPPPSIHWRTLNRNNVLGREGQASNNNRRPAAGAATGSPSATDTRFFCTATLPLLLHGTVGIRQSSSSGHRFRPVGLSWQLLVVRVTRVNESKICFFTLWILELPLLIAVLLS